MTITRTLSESPTTKEDLIALINRAIVQHPNWDNAGTAEAMLRLGMAKILLEANCPWEQIVSEWANEDRHNTIWFQIRYNGKNKFAESGPSAGEYDTLVFYVPTQARLAQLVRPDWTNQYFMA